MGNIKGPGGGNRLSGGEPLVPPDRLPPSPRKGPTSPSDRPPPSPGGRKITPPSRPAPSPGRKEVSPPLRPPPVPSQVADQLKPPPRKPPSPALMGRVSKEPLFGSKMATMCRKILLEKGIGEPREHELIIRMYEEIFEDCARHWGRLSPEETTAMKNIPKEEVLKTIKEGLSIEPSNSQLFSHMGGKIRFHAVKRETRRVDFYLFQNRIYGEGGFRRVYGQVPLSKEAPSEVLVVTKGPGLSPEEARAELEADLKILTILNGDGKPHRGIMPTEKRARRVGVIDSPTGSVGFLPMPTLGASLSRLCQRREFYQFPLSKQLKILQDAAEGVQYMRRNRIFHGDIKPSNILLDPSQKESYITDFGGSQVIETGDEIAEEYSSEYLLKKELQDAGTEVFDSDVFAMAKTIIETLVGNGPKGSESYALLQDLDSEKGFLYDQDAFVTGVIQDDLRKMLQSAQIPSRLTKALLRGVDSNRNERGTMMDLCNDLRQAQLELGNL